MVARTPPKHQRKLMVAPLNPILIKDTINKVDKCMARLQELQYTVAGGNKVVAGINLSPRSTRGYLKTSLRCKQETLRIKGTKRSPTGKLPSSNTEEWQRMSLPAMLLGETLKEILQASKFTKDIAQTISQHSSSIDDPKTPVRRPHTCPSDPDTNTLGIESRRKREKQNKLRVIRLESNSPILHRARSRINFKVPSPKRENRFSDNFDSEIIRHSANRVSPRHRPWAKKAVLFPNPLFNSSPNSQRQRFSKTKSPVIAKKKGGNVPIGATTTPTKTTTPHKFLVKSPTSGKSKFQVKIRSPVAVPKISPPRRAASPLRMTAAKLRRSLSPARLVNRLMSPLKSRGNSVIQGNGDCRGGGGGVSGLKQRSNAAPMRFSVPKISR